MEHANKYIKKIHTYTHTHTHTYIHTHTHTYTHNPIKYSRSRGFRILARKKMILKISQFSLLCPYNKVKEPTQSTTFLLSASLSIVYTNAVLSC
jgi:hypothetical protein